MELEHKLREIEEISDINIKTTFQLQDEITTLHQQLLDCREQIIHFKVAKMIDQHIINDLEKDLELVVQTESKEEASHHQDDPRSIWILELEMHL